MSNSQLNQAAVSISQNSLENCAHTHTHPPIHQVASNPNVSIALYVYTDR